MPFAGKRAMDALPADTPADKLKSLYVKPAKPLDLGGSKALVAHINSSGTVPGATGYEASITVTGAGDDELTKTFPITPNKWNELSLDISHWSARSAVNKIEVGFRALGVSDIWRSHFQIDEVTWNAAPTISADEPGPATVGSEFSFTVPATGQPSPTFAVTTGTLPKGLTMNTGTGVISGAPAKAGTANFQITASNGIGEDATATYAITVNAVAVEPADPAGPTSPDAANPGVPSSNSGPTVTPVSSTDASSSHGLAKTGSDLTMRGLLAALIVMLSSGLLFLRRRKQEQS